MALPILNILRTLAPLVVDAGRIVAGLRTSGADARSEERFVQLEKETIRAGELVKALAEQLQAVALELRPIAEQNEVLRRQTRIALIVSVVAVVLGASALIVAVVR